MVGAIDMKGLLIAAIVLVLFIAGVMVASDHFDYDVMGGCPLAK